MASKVNDEGTSEIAAIEIVINENQSDLSKSTEEGASTTNKTSDKYFHSWETNLGR